MNEENYGTEVSINELKGHYKTHFLTADQFIDLVKEWHESEFKKHTRGVKEIKDKIKEIEGLKKDLKEQYLNSNSDRVRDVLVAENLGLSENIEILKWVLDEK